MVCACRSLVIPRTCLSAFIDHERHKHIVVCDAHDRSGDSAQRHLCKISMCTQAAQMYGPELPSHLSQHTHVWLLQILFVWSFVGQAPSPSGGSGREWCYVEPQVRVVEPRRNCSRILLQLVTGIHVSACGGWSRSVGLLWCLVLPGHFPDL